KLVESIATQDHPVSISFAPKPSAAAGANANKDVSAEQVFDLLLRGLRDGWNAIPKAPQYFSSFGRWWHSPPESSGFLLYLIKLIVVLGLAGLTGWLALVLIRSIGPQRLPSADPAPLEQKLRPALVRSLKDVAATVVFIAVARFLAAHVFDPLAAEGKL